MIHKIKIKNFYSINKEQSIVFVDTNKNKNNSYLNSADQNLSKINMFVGSNASGKTNALKAFSFLRWLICDSFQSLPETRLAYKNFFGSKNPSNIEVVFEISSKIYTYNVEFTPERIIRESLITNELISERRSNKTNFVREWIESENKYKLEYAGIVVPEVVLVRKNASIFAILGQFLDPLSIEIISYWSKIQTNIFESGYGGDNPFDLEINLMQINQRTDEKNRIEKILQKFDLGFHSLDIDVDITNDQNVETHSYKGAKEVHFFDGQKKTNDILYSSFGTKRLILIIRFILNAITNQSPVILDEIDAYLHPEIIREIIDMFVDSDIHSQLIFTSHSHITMTILDKSQIFLVEKNTTDGGTEILQLDGIKGVRSSDNYYTKYIAGAYGAIPRL